MSASTAPDLVRSGELAVPTAEAMTELGRALAAALRAGDLRGAQR